MLDRLADAFLGQRAFVADASHELRTPLTVIGGQLEVLASQDAPSTEEVRRVERLVQSEIQRMGRLVEDLLLLAQAEQSDFLRIEPIESGSSMISGTASVSPQDDSSSLARSRMGSPVSGAPRGVHGDALDTPVDLGASIRPPARGTRAWRPPIATCGRFGSRV